MAFDAMTVERIREEKYALEAEITKLMLDFKQRTGTCVVGCDIETFQIRSSGGTPTVAAGRVRIKLEEI